jgi:hypothetical protein
LYPYRAEEAGAEGEHEEIPWTKQMSVAENSHMKRIIDKTISIKTRRKDYFEYLVKWRGHLVEYANWEDEEAIQKHGQTMKELMNKSS